MELLEWPELSLAVVSERVISGSAFPAMGEGGFLVAVHCYRKVNAGPEDYREQGKDMDEVCCWRSEIFDQVEAKRIDRFNNVFIRDLMGLMIALPWMGLL